MSFILEALKKVERERAARETPTLHSIALGEKAPRRSRWPWVISGALLLNATVAGILLWRHEIWDGGLRTDDVAANAAPGSVEPPEPARAAPEMKTTDTHARSNAKEESAKAVAPPPAVEPRPPQPAAAAPSAETALPARQQAPRDTPAREQQREARGDLKPPQPTPFKAPEAKLSGEPEIATPPAAAMLDQLEQKPVLAPPEDPRLDEMPSYAEMPAEVQAAVPDLKVSLMAYAPNAADRLVYIKNRRYVEGDVIEGKLKVETITRKGVVLSYDGERFLLSP
ncbi:MAG: general secretion pathway protein GspB [Pseudomonadota bacterium]|nr:general secretion pathway protein GspB [Pseudomonadota bacterium]